MKKDDRRSRNSWTVIHFSSPGLSYLGHYPASLPRPTALVCGTDILSFDACDEARRMGIEVPTQLSISGSDDISFAAMAVPALTSVLVPIAEIGYRSADNLIAQIKGSESVLHERLDIELVVRASTGVCVE